MRKRALFIVLAVLAYWLWRKFRPIPPLDTSIPITDNSAAPGTLGDSADADFANFVKTGKVPGSAVSPNAAAAPAAAANDPTASGDDGFTGGGGGSSGGAGSDRET